MQPTIFIWIPKTAGMSIFRHLERFGLQGLWRHASERHNVPDSVTFGHVSVMELLRTGALDSQFYKHAFKFCFVRNPFERLVSLWAYWTGSRNLDMTFRFFVHDRVCKDGELAVELPGLFNVDGLSQAAPMASWIPDEVDFIGRFENIETDFAKVCDRLGVAFYLQHENSSRHDHYSAYYDEETRAIVEKIYAIDLERFGYEFEKE